MERRGYGTFSVSQKGENKKRNNNERKNPTRPKKLTVSTRDAGIIFWNILEDYALGWDFLTLGWEIRNDDEVATLAPFLGWFSTYTLEGGKRNINKRGVNISIPLRGSPYSNSAVLLVGIRLLHIGFQIDECAKSLTGPFGRPTMGWLLTTGGPVGQPAPAPLSPQEEEKISKCCPSSIWTFGRTTDWLAYSSSEEIVSVCVPNRAKGHKQTKSFFRLCFPFILFYANDIVAEEFPKCWPIFVNFEVITQETVTDPSLWSTAAADHTHKKSRGNEPTRLYDDL